MSYSFPHATNVLVVNLGSGETPQVITSGGAVKGDEKLAEVAVEHKGEHIDQLLAEVDQSAYEIAEVVPGWEATVLEEPPKPEGELVPPNCNTEPSVPVNVHKNPSPLALAVGNNGEVPRWRPGSVIKWNWFTTGWPGGVEQANAVGNMMIQATLEWNSYNIGVQFALGTSLKECTFVLGYNAARTTLIAEAFFPNSFDLNYVNVYSQGIYTNWYTQLRAVFLHELGHVLGLRHEFALDPGREQGATQFGPRDAYSVMNYRPEPPRITPQDVGSARAFYAFRGSSIGGLPLRDYIPY